MIAEKQVKRRGPKQKPRLIPTSPAELAKTLGELGVTADGVSDRLGISTDTFYRDKEICDAWKKGRESTCEKLRSVQLRKALRGNVVMQIWLGKQMLGQRDRMEHGIGGIDGPPIRIDPGRDKLSDAQLQELLGILDAAKSQTPNPQKPSNPQSQPTSASDNS